MEFRELAQRAMNRSKKVAICTVASIALVGALSKAIPYGVEKYNQRKAFRELAANYHELVEKPYTPDKKAIERELSKWPAWLRQFIKTPDNPNGVIEVDICRRTINQLSSTLLIGVTDKCKVCSIEYELDTNIKRMLHQAVHFMNTSDQFYLSDFEIDVLNKFYFRVIRDSRNNSSVVHHEIFHALFSPDECNPLIDDPNYKGPTFEDIENYLEARFWSSNSDERAIYKKFFETKSGIRLSLEDFERMIGSRSPLNFTDQERKAYYELAEKFNSSKTLLRIQDLMNGTIVKEIKDEGLENWEDVFYSALYHTKNGSLSVRDLYLDEVFASLGASFVGHVDSKIEGIPVFRITAQDVAFFRTFEYKGQQMFTSMNSDSN